MTSTRDSAAFERLLTALPPAVQDELRLRRPAAPPPDTAAELIAALRGRMMGAATAEGRGGYPGRRGTPGWEGYVTEQRRSIAVLRALVDAFGASAALEAELRDWEERFPAPVRLMGDGYEPHVDDVAGRLRYSLPVDSGIVSLSFSYPITVADLTILRADPYRRAVLEVVAHVVLQRSMLRGNPEVTERDWRAIVDAVLHAPADALTAYIATVSRDHNIAVGYFVDAALARRGQAGSTPS